ncbi:MAG TPA: hypothetical protein VLW47_02685 [Thermodesulfobacteriota bacterium]|nr:hypothetical protein [Thermodesulfobacteriota bacterium]
MILREGEKLKKKESGIVYVVRKVDDKGFVILSSEDGSRSALMHVKDVDQYFSLIPVPASREVEAP